MSDNLFNSIFPDDPETDPNTAPADAESAASEASAAASDAANKLSEAADTVGDAAGAVVSDAADTVSEAADTVGDAAGAVVSEATEAGTDAITGAVETVGEAADKAVETVGDAAEAVKEDIEESSPFKRLMGAAAALVDAVIPDGDEAEKAKEEEATLADLAPAAVRSRAPEGTVTAPPVPDVEPVKDAKQWDDEVSPELAAVLFAGAKTVTDSAAPVIAKPALAPAAPVPAGSAPAGSAPDLPPAEPIELIRIEDARRLYLYAEGRSAPAPDAPLGGKVRHIRIEEPLKNDQGDRVVETWEYYKPDFPGLTGRLVREVRSEEYTFSDGSWRWRYERRYVDNGHDVREVRANKERTYIERNDEVSLIDAASGKRNRVKAEAHLIFAPPEEEKHGGFLSSLLGKDDEEVAQAPVWREASGKESRAARKAGGNAF